MASSSGAKQTLMVKRGDVAPNYIPYPSALARYEDVLINPKLFMETLEKLHAMLGTKFMIPIIGGKDLDLHRLFVEVTSRGGLEKVMRDKKWKEVTTVFNFPSTATNASFVLRKYYTSLVHHYEQIYFLKARGWIPSSDPIHNVPSPVISPLGLTREQPRRAELLPQDFTREQPRRVEFSPGASLAVPTDSPMIGVPSGSLAVPTGSPVMGVIDGKFESGYLITVLIGSEKLKGVLYQSSENPLPKTPYNHTMSISQNHNASHASNPFPTRTLRRRRRKKSEMKKRDPAHPKPNRSGYNFFFAEQHARLKPLYVGKDREISRIIGELWMKMNESDRAVYQDKAAKDKERYRTEMEYYKEKLKTCEVVSDALPIQQRPLELDDSIAGPSEGPDDDEISSKSDVMSDSENKIGDGHDSEWEGSPGHEIDYENAAAKEILPTEEFLELKEKVETLCGRQNEADSGNETRNESLECGNGSIMLEEKETTHFEKGEMENLEHVLLGESKQKEVPAEENVASFESKNRSLEMDKKDHTQKKGEGVDESLKSLFDDGTAESKKRLIPVEEEESIACEKKQKFDDDI